MATYTEVLNFGILLLTVAVITLNRAYFWEYIFSDFLEKVQENSRKYFLKNRHWYQMHPGICCSVYRCDFTKYKSSQNLYVEACQEWVSWLVMGHQSRKLTYQLMEGCPTTLKMLSLSSELYSTSQLIYFVLRSEGQ